MSTVKPWAMVTATSSGSTMLTSCVSSSANTIPVSGDRIVPPRIAPMLTSGQKPTPSAGRNHASTPPSAPPIISSGASTPPDVPDPSDTDQITDLTIEDAEDDASADVALQQLADDVVADAERLREHPAADADHQAADRRPPHPVDRQALEGVFRRRSTAWVSSADKRAGEQAGEHAAQQALRSDERGMRRHRETAVRGR